MFAKSVNGSGKPQYRLEVRVNGTDFKFPDLRLPKKSLVGMLPADYLRPWDYDVEDVHWQWGKPTILDNAKNVAVRSVGVTPSNGTVSFVSGQGYTSYFKAVNSGLTIDSMKDFQKFKPEKDYDGHLPFCNAKEIDCRLVLQSHRRRAADILTTVPHRRL